MNKKTIISSALALTLLISGSSAFAATTEVAGTPGTTDTPAVTTTPKVTHKLKTKIKAPKKMAVTGVITAINGTSFTIEKRHLLKSKAAASVTVQTDATTVFSKNKATVALSDLAVGQRVIITGTVDKTTHDVVASKVRIVVPSVKTKTKVKPATPIIPPTESSATAAQ